ncbi:LuxR family transcriptional regulator [Agromyces sp. H66]|uniref:helix-turn-helix transcriptional regulator n=1 Tax=Agromyces sp. H66 TaxID=2529859 RepID=UPI0010AAE08C|nr:LuxR family transcriptional regulator [Agromyces sp. H66]
MAPGERLLVGRDAELDDIGRVLGGVTAGTASTLLLSGEAGIGKTSLLDAVVSRFASEALVLSGRCLPLSSLSLPFLALRSALRAAADRLALDGLGGDLFTGADDLSAVPLRVDDLLTRLAGDRPVLLAIDDLQWADESTLDCLMFLIAGPEDRPLGIIGTLRSTEVGDRRLIEPWLADVHRLPRVVSRTVAPLDRFATSRLIASLLGGAVHESLVQDVYDRARGNPYLTKLLVTGLDQHARRAGVRLPEDLRGAVLRTWARLPERARELTRTIALFGGPVALDRLSTVTGIPVGELSATTRDLVTAGILEPGEQRSYWFHHPLIAEALIASIPPDDLRTRHAALARYFDQVIAESDDPPVEWFVKAADHHDAAGETQTAFGALLRAADEAARAGGARERVRLLHRAVESADLLPDRGISRPDLLRRLDDAAVAAGDVEQEWGAVTARLDGLDRAEHPLEAAVLLVRRMHLRFRTGRGYIDPADAREAVRLASAAPGSTAAALAVAELAHALALRRDPEMHELAERGVRLATATGDERTLAYAISAKALVHNVNGNRTAALALAREAFRAGLAAGDPWVAMRSAIWGSYANVARRDILAQLRTHRQEMSEYGAPPACIAMLSATEARELVIVGGWHEAVERLRVALGSDPGPLVDVNARLTAARLSAGQGRIDEAKAHLERADELFAEQGGFLSYPFHVVRTEVLLAAGEVAAAERTAVDGLARHASPVAMHPWLLPLAARAIADRVQESRDHGADVAGLLRRLRALLGEHLGDTRMAAPFMPAGGAGTSREEQHALTCLAIGERARAEADPLAPDRWAEAVEAAHHAALAWEESYALLREAEAVLVHLPAERSRAANAVRRGLETAHALGAAPIVGELLAIARSARIPTETVEHAASDLALAGVAEAHGLTEREREILAFIVAGRSYGEIARELYISEKTVSSHVSNLLRKTGTRNRLDLARLARARVE